MWRSLLGVLMGASFGFLIGYYIGCWAGLSYYLEPRDGPALMLGGTLCGVGALAGAVVGGVGDIVACLRRLHPNLPRTGPEADYRERT
ncbi:MAG TPA: hypothetical protein VKD90_29070 [Gemmataceae bacterium]|nr:hypothetical protein [Gemmataceae bacterium]